MDEGRSLRQQHQPRHLEVADALRLRRMPVLLLHGWNGNARQLQRMADFLASNGWPDRAVRVHGFERSWGSNVRNAAEIQRAIDLLRSDNDCALVDVVAHSMSGLALRWHIAHAPEHAVRRAVFLASPHRGTWLAHLVWGDGAREMRPRSQFLETLRACRLPPEIRAYTIRTILETRIVPLDSTRLEGACRDIVIRNATHLSMLRNRRVLELVLECLLEEPAPATH